MINQKGSILIFSVLMLGVILTITLSLGNIYLPRLKTSTEAINSVAAVYTADSALEWCLHEQRGRTPSVVTPTISIIATYTIYFGSGIATCAPAEDPLNHRAVGTYKGVTRSLDIVED
ncbi:MAG: hypothetical protein UT29_C0001G0100 [Candidatus Yanofskybacteria bacterium GW2011_GWA1_39_13]|uniref:Uncharacterized protein n=1 Tax=Yanofskybacteria sp. (strain GW2011_GWA1_39_13) TaxID=1619019 RepID=A0A0G0PWV2_YANXG|nr:MAG: hypothetical protein UT29_C0001G0100 [Candidatus Yanofskybacteria bacterium GW2011_GWA1_39_13]